MVSYAGDVSPGGPPQTRKAGCVTITKVAVDPDMSNNAYLLHCEETDEVVLIDAAADAPTLLTLIGDRPLTAVVTTHQHWDHHRALAEVVAATGATVIAGAPDAAEITSQTGVAVDRTVTHGDRVAAGTCDLTVIALAGHTPGSIALFWEDDTGQGHLFTGDSLFPGGVGNTFGDAAAFESLIEDVSTKVFDVYGDDVWFYPGHGSDSTLGAERPHLAEWRERGW
jgi:glyoxylase-like metal-dependent hydrolase (beta-lactamase superfamily II)